MKEYSTNNDIIYFIDEEKRVVVAKYFPKPVIEKLLNAFSDIFESVQLSEFFEDNFILNDYYIGIAKCSAEDVFDIEYGKQLARLRAIYKYRLAKTRIMCKFNNWIQSKLFEVTELIQKESDASKKIETKLSTILGVDD